VEASVMVARISGKRVFYATRESASPLQMA
jgi:hypothetical protein